MKKPLLLAGRFAAPPGRSPSLRSCAGLRRCCAPSPGRSIAPSTRRSKTAPTPGSPANASRAPQALIEQAQCRLVSAAFAAGPLHGDQQPDDGFWLHPQPARLQLRPRFQPSRPDRQSQRHRHRRLQPLQRRPRHGRLATPPGPAPRAAEQDLHAAQQPARRRGGEGLSQHPQGPRGRRRRRGRRESLRGRASPPPSARFDAGQMLKADLLSLEVQLAQTRARPRLAPATAPPSPSEPSSLCSGSTPPASPWNSPATILRSPAWRCRTPAIFPSGPNCSACRSASAPPKPWSAPPAAAASRRSTRSPATSTTAAGSSTAHADSWMAGVSVDLNVFDGGQTSGKIRQSTAELAQVKEMLRKATLGIGLEVEQARLAHDDARRTARRHRPVPSNRPRKAPRSAAPVSRKARCSPPTSSASRAA